MAGIQSRVTHFHGFILCLQNGFHTHYTAANRVALDIAHIVLYWFSLFLILSEKNTLRKLLSIAWPVVIPLTLTLQTSWCFPLFRDWLVMKILLSLTGILLRVHPSVRCALMTFWEERTPVTPRSSARDHRLATGESCVTGSSQTHIHTSVHVSVFTHLLFSWYWMCLRICETIHGSEYISVINGWFPMDRLYLWSSNTPYVMFSETCACWISWYPLSNEIRFLVVIFSRL